MCLHLYRKTLPLDVSSFKKGPFSAQILPPNYPFRIIPCPDRENRIFLHPAFIFLYIDEFLQYRHVFWSGFSISQQFFLLQIISTPTRHGFFASISISAQLFLPQIILLFFPSKTISRKIPPSPKRPLTHKKSAPPPRKSYFHTQKDAPHEVRPSVFYKFNLTYLISCINFYHAKPKSSS